MTVQDTIRSSCTIQQKTSDYEISLKVELITEIRYVL